MKTLLSKKMMANGGAIDTTPVRFDYTGAVQEYLIPKGVKKLAVDCVGAAGTKINNLQGSGGRVQCILNVSAGTILFIYVGGQGKIFAGGWNGGGKGGNYNGGTSRYYGSGGGGASDIRTIKASDGSWYLLNHTSWEADKSLLSRLVVAGGAGGTFRSIGSQYPQVAGGAGGGLISGGGYHDYYDTRATQTAGGAGFNKTDYEACKGKFGKGGDDLSTNDGFGGGGGGWYGGGAANDSGGGSSYTHPDLCSEVEHVQGYSEATSNGWIVITPIR